jgi:predicted alpha-1,2-mannosidase
MKGRLKNIDAIFKFIAGGIFMAMPFNTHAQSFIKYVDPFIGTGGHGHTYPGATVPFGMVQLSPDNGTQGWDWCGGYHYTDSMIAGFSHTHLSGTGIGDLCDISVMPANGLINDTISLYREKFAHSNEKATPGFYEVTLNNGIKAAFTTTERCGLHQYTFPKGSEPVIRFNLGFAINWDSPTETFIEKLNDSTIVGYRYSKGWAHTQRLYFAARTDKPFSKLYLSNGKVGVNGNTAKGKLVKGQLLFKDLQGKSVSMKVALSTVSTAKA